MATLWEQLVEGNIKYAIDEPGNITSIGTSAFFGCSDLLIASFPSVTSIAYWAFQGCTNLLIANFPACVDVGANAFQECSKLRVVSFPSLIDINIATFNKTGLTNAYFPNVMSVRGAAFNSCPELRCISFGASPYIGEGAFNGCSNLFSLYLMGSTVCSCSSTTYNPFLSGTPIQGITGKPYGSIYVPASLYNSYLIAPGWSRYSARFASV